MGEKQSLAGIDVVSALGKNYDPWVANISPPGDQFSTAWVMLENGFDYAQVGWMEFIGDERYTFAEYSIPNSELFVRDVNPPEPEGEFTVYAVYLSDVWPNVFTFRAGPPSLEGYPPPIVHYHQALFTPFRAFVSSEISNFTHQMAGGYGAGKKMVWDAAYIHGWGTGWFNMNGAVSNTNPAEFGYSDLPPHPIYGGASFMSWDGRCSW